MQFKFSFCSMKKIVTAGLAVVMSAALLTGCGGGGGGDQSA